MFKVRTIFLKDRAIVLKRIVSRDKTLTTAATVSVAVVTCRAGSLGVRSVHTTCQTSLVSGELGGCHVVQPVGRGGEDAPTTHFL